MNKKITITVGMLIGVVAVVAAIVWLLAYWHAQHKVEGVNTQTQQEEMKARLVGKRAKAKSLAKLALTYYKEKHAQPYLVQRALFALIDVQQDEETMDLVKHLLDTKLFEVDALNDRGQTALFHAAAKGDSELAKLLLEYGANPNSLSEHGAQTALNGALIKPDVVKVLLQQDANPNVQMNDGKTVLMNTIKIIEKASTSRNPQQTIEKCKKIIDFLLAYGASPTIVDKQGVSAMDRLKNLQKFYADPSILNDRFSEQDRQNVLILCRELEIEFESRGRVTS